MQMTVLMTASVITSAISLRWKWSTKLMTQDDTMIQDICDVRRKRTEN